jgi:predicted DCC family thiol-disulfide oxidoreductase YuxK
MRIPSAKGWVLYDGDCAFCVRWLHLLGFFHSLQAHYFSASTLTSPRNCQFAV